MTDPRLVFYIVQFNLRDCGGVNDASGHQQVRHRACVELLTGPEDCYYLQINYKTPVKKLPFSFNQTVITCDGFFFSPDLKAL